MDRWNDLHEMGAYSVPAEIGRTAILCSYFTDIYACTDEEARNKLAERDKRIFRNEALALADAIEQSDRAADVYLNATGYDMNAVLADPYVSEVHVIGNGNLSEVFMENDGEDTYDWIQAQTQADHLKTGVFVQRHCGAATRHLPVPLGLFVVAEHNQVIAPVGRYFAPRGLFHPHVGRLRRVTDHMAISPEEIQSFKNVSYLSELIMSSEPTPTN